MVAQEFTPCATPKILSLAALPIHSVRFRITPVRTKCSLPRGCFPRYLPPKRGILVRASYFFAGAGVVVGAAGSASDLR
jgi:hypothetical protein